MKMKKMKGSVKSWVSDLGKCVACQHKWVRVWMGEEDETTMRKAELQETKYGEDESQVFDNTVNEGTLEFGYFLGYFYCFSS